MDFAASASSSPLLLGLDSIRAAFLECQRQSLGRAHDPPAFWDSLRRLLASSAGHSGTASVSLPLAVQDFLENQMFNYFLTTLISVGWRINCSSLRVMAFG